jgi:polar amino acid transport system substrate-binding protein
MMRSIRRGAVVGLVGVCALSLGLAACSSKGNTPSGTTPSSGVDAALAAKVPAAIKAKGSLTIGTDSTYAPSEYLDTDGHTVIGFDVDLFNAVAAKLGLKTQWQSAAFADIIPGVASGKYDIGVSSFTINSDREKSAAMISYFAAGTQWAQKSGGSIDPNNACGKKIAVQASTVQVDDITARSKACTTAGKPGITIDQYQAQNDATNAVISGKDAAMLADSPVCAYAVKQTSGQLALDGNIYDSAPYGYVLPLSATDFASAIAGGVQDLITDGSYLSILKKWGVDAGAITNPSVNPTVS